jgi:hypothetical protein
MEKIMVIVHTFMQRLLIVVALFGVGNLLHAAETVGGTEKLQCISGGVGETERDSLKNQSEQFNFWLITAVKKSGAFLSGVNVRVFDAQSKQLLITCTMDGPWLFVNLPAGRFNVETSYRENATQTEQIMREKITIRKNERRQIVHYFKTDDDVGATD